jgi:hypothetical protein
MRTLLALAVIAASAGLTTAAHADPRSPYDWWRVGEYRVGVADRTYRYNRYTRRGRPAVRGYRRGLAVRGYRRGPAVRGYRYRRGPAVLGYRLRPAVRGYRSGGGYGYAPRRRYDYAGRNIPNWAARAFLPGTRR